MEEQKSNTKGKGRGGRREGAGRPIGTKSGVEKVNITLRVPVATKKAMADMAARRKQTITAMIVEIFK